MILTARQLEHMLKTTGRIVLPYRARLTPSAQDFVRHNKVTIGYDNINLDPKSLKATQTVGLTNAPKAGPEFLWWSDGPDGVAKAAIGMASREVTLSAMAILSDASRVTSAVRQLTQDIASNKAVGGVLLVKNAAVALVYANKSPRLRATVATTLAAAEEAIKEVAANVLVIEHDRLSLIQLKNLLTKFCRAEPVLDPVTAQELEDLSN